LSDIGPDATVRMETLFDCPIVIGMLADDSALRAVLVGDHARELDGLSLGLVPGAVHLSMSTISTAAARMPPTAASSRYSGRHAGTW
jgi:3-hydroxyisobutyrate dehydrogenase-like beta-hydroxyacid dehydrogenase